MQAVPEGINIDEIKTSLEKIENVHEVEHIHVWQLDDKKKFFEAHILLSSVEHESAKEKVRHMLENDFGISHSTIETKEI